MGRSYNNSAPNPSPPFDREEFLKRDNSSVNAVSFGFLATAILISLFLVMAIVERFLRARPSFPPLPSLDDRQQADALTLGSQGSTKGAHESKDVLGVSVLMPGQDIPTFIANPAPIPCSLEGSSSAVQIAGKGQDTGSSTAMV